MRTQTLRPNGRNITGVCGIALICGILAGPAGAVTPACGPHDQMLALLKGSYGEVPALSATTAGESPFGEQIIEWTVSPQGETWSMIVVFPDGKACFLLAGTAWKGPLPGTAI